MALGSNELKPFGFEFANNIPLIISKDDNYFITYKGKLGLYLWTLTKTVLLISLSHLPISHMTRGVVPLNSIPNGV